MKNIEPSPRRRGRPRGFDRDEALARAVEAFWQRGYEGTSIADLTEAMNITPQSLYAAFSSKAELYAQALAWYQEHIGSASVRALSQEPHAVAALAGMLREAAGEFAHPGRPHGCMVSTAVLGCAVENEPVARHVAALRNATLAHLRTRIEQGVRDGHLKPETDPGALARFVGAIIQGMSVQARDGATQSDLRALAEHAVSEIARHRA
ncbi:TetR/AcrR family transcriptional regulator [Rhizobiaceae bacterium BDR2-2]|uniref:TetR/AcrR family transcriptional regulator n=1 Tax=Ectorhizobium quercum TaxID=2965071 RepID=A0AAE3SUZ1_9HYPH|nr:TetR/AcrR family transcriptional regulator [Ectorhizobium quercum]MCX8997775.1 TetR/AcrR family transcriptional regulator [Ectorhizobium quercum]